MVARASCSPKLSIGSCYQYWYVKLKNLNSGEACVHIIAYIVAARRRRAATMSSGYRPGSYHDVRAHPIYRDISSRSPRRSLLAVASRAPITDSAVRYAYGLKIRNASLHIHVPPNLDPDLDVSHVVIICRCVHLRIVPAVNINCKFARSSERINIRCCLLLAHVPWTRG